MSLQFCLAHLIRDVKFLTTLPDSRDRMYGTRFREALRELFGVIHRRELLTAERVQAQLEAARAKVLDAAHTTCPRPTTVATWRSGSRSMGELFPVRHDPGSGADQ